MQKYLLAITLTSLLFACKDNVELEKGLNVVEGKVVYKGVSDAFGLEYTDVSEVL